MSPDQKEKKIISYIKSHSDFHEGLAGIGIGDDAAFLLLSSMDEGKLVISTDSVVEGVHFKIPWGSYRDSAVKLIQRASSDLLSKGAHPHWVLLNMNITPGFASSEKDWKAFIDSFCSELKTHHIRLIGGDVTRSAVNSFTATVLGNASLFVQRKNPEVKKGDLVVLSGKVGGSSLALEKLLLDQSPDKNILEAYNCPTACWDNLWLKELDALVSMDQSDSLWETLLEISEENSLELQVDLENIPLHFSPQGINDLHVRILKSAEDLAVLAIIPYSKKDEVKNYSSLAIIGEVLGKGQSGISLKYRGESLALPEDFTFYGHF